MIVSHKHRFIYLKSRRTGSTSVEIALADLCGPDDIVTPLNGDRTPADPERRINWQNHEIPRERWPLLARVQVGLGATKRAAGVELFNHIRARRLRALIGPEVFDAYRKVSIERNPWDREVSSYFFTYKRRGRRPSFEDFVATLGRGRKPIDNFDIYSLDGRVIADPILRFETLAEDFARLMAMLGIPDPPALPHANASARRGEKAYRELYTATSRDRVAEVYRREIDHFGYRF